MNYVTINEKAAAMALDFVVGAEVRVGIERLYELLEDAMQSAYDEGFEEGEGADVEDTFNAGYDAGYEQARADTDANKEEDESEGFYDASDEYDETGEENDIEAASRELLAGLISDECMCETCTVERAEASEQDDTLTTPVPLPPMQEQRASNPFS